MARTAYLAVSVLLVAGVAVQVFLAGLGVFDKPASFETHRDFGYMLEVLPILLVIIGAVGRLGRRLIGLPALVFGLFIVQSILIGVRGSAPAVAALHPVNGFLIALISVLVARWAWLGRRRDAGPSPAA